MFIVSRSPAWFTHRPSSSLAYPFLSIISKTRSGCPRVVRPRRANISVSDLSSGASHSYGVKGCTVATPAPDSASATRRSRSMANDIAHRMSLSSKGAAEQLTLISIGHQSR